MKKKMILLIVLTIMLSIFMGVAFADDSDTEVIVDLDAVRDEHMVTYDLRLIGIGIGSLLIGGSLWFKRRKK